MADVTYLELGPESLELIRPLWEKLNDHHLVRSPDFRQHYEQMTFDVRKADLLKKERLRIILAILNRAPVGYCVCTVAGDTGEVDSIFVEDAYRRSGIGEQLMYRALVWLKAAGPEKTIVAVAAGNEAATPFYESFGFMPRMTVLQLVQGPRS